MHSSWSDEDMTDKPDTHAFIDKLSIAVGMPPQLAMGLPETLYGWLGDKEMMHAHGLSRLFGVAGGRYKASLQGRVPLPDSETGWSEKAGFVFQGGPKDAGVAPARLDINPLCLNPEGIAHVRTILENSSAFSGTGCSMAA